METSDLGAVRVALLIPAAGSGERLGLGKPKALADAGGAPLIRRTLERLAAAADFAETIVLAPQGSMGEIVAALDGVPSSLGRVRVSAGGATRQASVQAGLAALAGADIDIVCVHDAARPLVEASTVRAVLEAARRSGAATAASRPADSIRLQEGSRTRALDRDRLWLVETPQAFTRHLLVHAHAHAAATGLQGTDDASLVDAIAVEIQVVASEGRNMKVTTTADLAVAVQLLGPYAR